MLGNARNVMLDVYNLSLIIAIIVNYDDDQHDQNSKKGIKTNESKIAFIVVEIVNQSF